LSRELDATEPARLTLRMTETGPSGGRAAFARHLIRVCGRAALATNMRGAPYVSLVILVADLDASPLLLLSDLAQHSRNIAFDPRISLLVDATEHHPDPLTGPRLTLLGRAQSVADPRRLARFTAHHPTSAAYAGFGDFRLYRVTVERGHLVAGFGRIHWIEGDDLAFVGDPSGLAAAEAEILRHMNEDHSDAVGGYARRLLGRPAGAWIMTGIDPEGADLRCDRETARLDFPRLVLTGEAARAMLTELTEQASK
jgi:putative heme iron utilization protein